MKKHYSIPMAMIILAGILTVGANAQTVSAQRVLANVPFTFSVGNKTLPAGKYTITVLNPTSDQKILQIRSTDGRSSAMILTMSVLGKASDNARLVFHRYDNRYLFVQAQMAGDETSLAAVKSSSKRSGKSTMATTGKKTVVVVIAE